MVGGRHVVSAAALVAGAFATLHECIHDTHIVPSIVNHPQWPVNVQQPDDDMSVNLTERIKRRRLQAGQPFKLKLDFSYLDNGKYQCSRDGQIIPRVDGSGSIRCNQANVVNSVKRKYIRDLANAAKDYFEGGNGGDSPAPANLRLNFPPRGNTRILKYCFQYAPPPNGDAETTIDRSCFRDQQGCGFDITEHMTLTVTANPTEGATLAFALTCQSDRDTGRPIAGLVNFGPARLAGTSVTDENFKSELSTAIHEIGHALGFSSSKFGDFLDQYGRRLGRDNVVREFRERGTTVAKIITPRVKQAVKEQFQCFDWPTAGAELENFGGSGTAGSHWEKRLFRDEYMTGTDSLNPVYSALSLALFQDSGWYSVDFSSAEHLHWGYHEGCTFARSTCNQWDDRFFCSGRGARGCNHNFFYKSQCNLVSYGGTLPSSNSYFTDSRLGGRDQHADFCPFYSGFSNGDCRNTKYETSQGRDIFGETYGEESRCIVSNAINPRYVRQPESPRCFAVDCANGVLKIKVGGNQRPCPRNGGRIDLTGTFVGGHAICPPYADICPTNSFVSASMAEDTAFAVTLTGNDEIKNLNWIGLTNVSVDKGSRSYFKLNLSMDDSTTGIISLLVKGLDGMLYMKAGSFDEQKPPPTKTGSKDGTQETALVLPSETNNDEAFKLEKIEGPRTITVGRRLQEVGDAILLGVVATETTTAGTITVTYKCASMCMNKGNCNSMGLCECPAGFQGFDCSQISCPSDCSMHGECDTKTRRCTCNVGWTGQRCENMDMDHRVSAAEGTVDVGAWGYFWADCPKSTLGQGAVLTYTLDKKDTVSDPFLFAGAGNRKPTWTDYAKRDLSSWKATAARHSVSLQIRMGDRAGITIGILNHGDYSSGRLHYKGSISCETGDGNKSCPISSVLDSEAVCGGHGTCQSGVCTCTQDWIGKACDIFVVSARESSAESPPTETKRHAFTINQNGAMYIAVKSPLRFVFAGVMDGAGINQGVPLHVSISGQPKWMGISMNRGENTPVPCTPKAADFHNWGQGKWSFTKTMKSELLVDPCDADTYTIMIENPLISGSVDFYLDISWNVSQGYIVERDQRIAALVAQQEMCIPSDNVDVPLAMMNPDGTISDAVLALSSHLGVEGMASSTQMKILEVKEFKFSDGSFRKASDFTGKVTICANGPAFIFTGHTGDSIPKQAAMFEQCLVAKMGVVPSTWSSLNMWKDLCVFVTTVDVSKEKHFVGIAAANEGEFVSFAAVVEGEDHLSVNTGGGWSTLEVVIVAIGSASVVAVLGVGVYFCRSRAISARPAEESELGRVRDRTGL
eukprot:TRINITY_DN40988_c0_g1_i1.p1 TRINITY_DN40988_c0_g1~~TRINITY_DN40988_c0_g1_i1.p1  ORF type:complete len:1340 (+),score=192.93 TRINITY_DN40988_c0_g1_i1:90-4022(+)